MRRLFVLFSVLFLAFDGVSQFNNSWIDYTQQYYKIPVAETGVYRLTYSDLDAVNFPLSSVDPRSIRLYHRGVEQAIIVTGQLDATFNNGDYIEFYGEKNDGTLDQTLYKTPETQPHQYYNLYSDTTAYFLTWTLGVNGKRMANYKVNNVDNLAKEPFHLQENIQVNTEEYATGYSLGEYIQLTTFDEGEGWSGVTKQEGQYIDYVISNITKMVTNLVKPSIELQLVGRDDKSHLVEIQVGKDAGSLRAIGTSTFELYETKLFNSDIDWSDISLDGTLLVRCFVQGVAGGNDKASINYVKLNYPQQWDMSSLGKKEFITPPSGSNSYIEVVNTPNNLTLLDITNVNEPLIVGFNGITNGISAVIKNTSIERKLYAYNEVITPSIHSTKFNALNIAAYDYIIISHSALMKPGGVYANPVQAFADYRGSEIGGNLNVLMLDINDVFNQYSYGEFSPLAVREFLKHWVTEGVPKGLFIIGKSLLVGASSKIEGVNYFYRKNPEAFEYKDLIPTAGRPGSDIVYGMGLKGNENELDVPVGRLTASTPQQVAAYLDKVKEMEAAPLDELWKKNILHLSGGTTSEELTRFENHVNEFKNTAEDLYLGGKVHSIRKQSSNDLEFLNTTDLINKGLNLVTFFGHSASNITDIDIGYVSDPVHGYNNKGKYPLLLVNGCQGGQVFGNGFNWSEDWMLTPEIGAIGLIAHSHYGYENALSNYSNIFYKKAFGDSSLIYQPLGKIFQEVIKQYRNDYRNDFGLSTLNITQTEQMILIGDPMVRLFNAKAPDYAISDTDILFQSYQNGNVTALVDSFAIGVIIRNYGRADNDSIRLNITRTLEDNTELTYDSLFPSVYYMDTLSVNIKNESEYAGRNRFKITIDYLNSIKELIEDNNEANVTKELTLNGTKHLFPNDFGIVNKRTVNLRLQSAAVVDQSKRNYLIEIDTLNTFNSPYRKEYNVSADVLLQLDIELLDRDSVVYYWRSKFAALQPGENENWSVSSFTFINAEVTGWMQSHRQQLVNDEFQNVSMNPINGDFSFEQNEVTFDLQIYGDNHPTENYETIQFEIDGLPYIYPGRICRYNNKINLVAFSKETAKPYAGLPYDYWSFNTCGRQDQVINSFTYAQIVNSGSFSVDSTDNLLQLYMDSVKVGDYILIFTQGNIQFNDWSPELLSQIERVGGSSATVSSLGYGEPYILFGRKGDSPGTALEIIATEAPFDEQTLALSKTVYGSLGKGKVKSTIIGPAQEWLSFNNRIELLEPNIIDYSFDIYGISNEGIGNLMLSNITDKSIDISHIDAALFPYLSVEIHLFDDVNLTSSQLDFWQVAFVEVPDGVLLLDDNQDGYQLSKQEGETFTTAFKFINVTESNFLQDSLIVNQIIRNQQTGDLFETDFKIQAPNAGDTTHYTTQTNTIDKLGLNDFQLIVNDYVEQEKYYDNNALNLPNYFDVFGDRYNPILQVTFDGDYIENGAIVSPTPVIDISLKDENTFLLMTDTTGISVFLKTSCSADEFEQIYFSSSQLSWSFDEVNGEMNIQFTPERFEDGNYAFQVIAEDYSGNRAGIAPYCIEFEVMNASTFTEFYIYPNPITKNSHMFFQITGAEVPEVIELQIMNLNGKVVRTITQDEFNNLRIGKNTSQFSWNGNDQTGKTLPNGVYIYRLKVQLNGQNLVQSSTILDNSGKTGVGKLYIMR